MFKVKYTGEASGKFKGPATCHMYSFSPEACVQYVDKRDIPHFESFTYNDVKVFEVVSEFYKKDGN